MEVIIFMWIQLCNNKFCFLTFVYYSCQITFLMALAWFQKVKKATIPQKILDRVRNHLEGKISTLNNNMRYSKDFHLGPEALLRIIHTCSSTYCHIKIISKKSIKFTVFRNGSIKFLVNNERKHFKNINQSVKTWSPWE